MAYKRKRASGRRVRGRRFKRARRTARRGRRASNALSTQRYFRWSSVAGLDSTVNGFGQGLTLNLESLPSYQEYTSLFDKYSVNMVKYRWFIDTDPMVVATTKRYPRIHFVHDFTDATPPASLNEINQYPKKREVFLGDSRQATRWYAMKPAIHAVMYESVATSGYVPKWRQMLSTSDSSVPYYGLKTWVEGLATGVSLVLEAKVFLRCVNPK